MSDTAYQPTQAVDVVGIFDQNFDQLFPDARPAKGTIARVKKLMKHPVESGGTIVDFWVIEPIKIDFELILKPSTYVDTYNQIVQAFIGNNTVQIQTNVGLFPNMVLGGIPHKEDPAHFDTIVVNLSAEEVQIVATSTSPLPQSAQTQNGGNVTGQNATPTQTAQATETTQNSNARNSVLYNLTH